MEAESIYSQRNGHFSTAPVRSGLKYFLRTLNKDFSFASIQFIWRRNVTKGTVQPMIIIMGNILRNQPHPAP